jgi:nucleoside 2-deoxyribosyltransferase
MNTKIYIAGAISGQKIEDVIEKFNNTKSILQQHGFLTLSPLEGVKPRVNISEREQDNEYKPEMKNRAIVQRDKYYVQQADIIFADLRNCTRTSIGTCFEIAWAAMWNKYIIAVIDKDDINHRHAFLLENVSVVFDKYDDAIQHLIEIG